MRINIIYMAAGNSRRFGSNKLLYPLEGKPLYQHGLERLLSVCARHPDWMVFVVTRYEEILEQVKSLSGEQPWQSRETGRTALYAVPSQQSCSGISYTIRAGILCAEQEAPEAEGYAFFTADQPHLSAETMERFLTEMEAQEHKEQALGSLCFQDVPGNPAYFSRAYLPELLALEGDTGGRRILKRHPEQVRFVQAVSEGELCDVDTPEKVQEKLDFSRCAY